jgi:hypothetical protein
VLVLPPRLSVRRRRARLGKVVVNVVGLGGEIWGRGGPIQGDVEGSSRGDMDQYREGHGSSERWINTGRGRGADRGEVGLYTEWGATTDKGETTLYLKWEERERERES